MSNQWDNQPSSEPSGQDPQYGQGYPGAQNPRGQQWQGQQHPSQEPYPPQQQWAQNGPVYGAPAGYGAPPVKRSPILGAVGLLIVALATVAVVITSWVLGSGLGSFLLEVAADGAGSFNQNDLANDPRIMAYAETAVGPIGAFGLACLAGFVGWIISIVATASNRGRVFGIIGIVLGVLALPIAYGAASLALAPVITQLGG